MSNQVLEVQFYRSSAGKEPVRDFLRALTAEDRKAIGTDIKTVELGWPLGMPLVRKIDPDLWEVRSHVADGIARVLFTTLDYRMVLLHAFIKKSQKIPSTDLDTAHRRLRQVQRGAS